MAVVLPTLRLWLLLLNVYRTFKSMKPPPQSQRSARNGNGPSAKAMQLRKRELKSCLAVWVVWAMFSTVEGPLDRTIGLVTPFYNELKCIVFLFLLVARSHGAEAIFLHIIHPLLRPYVPAVDDILANLHSVFELFTLILFLPWEYMSYKWHQWRWSRETGSTADDDDSPNDLGIGGEGGGGEGGGGDALSETRRRLRPRNEVQQASLRDVQRQTQVVFQDIDEAQGRVRTRTRSQPAVRGRNQPFRGGRGTMRDSDLDPNAVGLRTRRRVLEYPPAESERAPGSRTTGVHHIYPALPQVPLSQPFPAFPQAPVSQPVPLPSQPVMPTPTPTPPSSNHEIWHPPQSAFDARASSNDPERRSPSPIYPPLPSAYQFTPRRSEPLPPPPRIISPPQIVTPTPRRVSTGASRGAFDAFESGARVNQAGPSRSVRSAEPALSGDKRQDEDFFGQALEQPIQVEGMDMDTETLSTRDSSSANKEAMEVEDGENEVEQRSTVEGMASRERGGLRNRRGQDSEIKRGKRKAPEPSRRSRRTRNERSSSVETDEFGFTIRPNSRTLGSTSADTPSSSSHGIGTFAAGTSKKKPLARTKPALKTVQGDEDKTESSDEESVKKRRKLRPGTDMFYENHGLGYQDAEEENRDKDESTLRQRDNGVVRGRAKRKATVRRTEAQPVSDVKLAGPGPTRTTRASTKQLVYAKRGHLQGAGGTKQGRGK